MFEERGKRQSELKSILKRGKLLPINMNQKVVLEILNFFFR